MLGFKHEVGRRHFLNHSDKQYIEEKTASTKEISKLSKHFITTGT